jgi:hypothetical protein
MNKRKEDLLFFAGCLGIVLIVICLEGIALLLITGGK